MHLTHHCVELLCGWRYLELGAEHYKVYIPVDISTRDTWQTAEVIVQFSVELFLHNA